MSINGNISNSVIIGSVTVYPDLNMLHRSFTFIKRIMHCLYVG